jgi:cell division GTPase FtsZ
MMLIINIFIISIIYFNITISNNLRRKCMNSYIEVNDADYKYILAKGGRVEQFSGIFNNNDSVESALKPIINDLKQSKGILIKFILSNEYKKLDNIEKFMLKINEIAPIDTVIIFGVYYDDLKVETFKCDILISGLPEN